MNVVKFDIEIRKRFFCSKDKSVSKLIDGNFLNEFEQTDNLAEEIKKEWQDISSENLRALKSEKNIKLYLTIKNIKIFIFENTATRIKSKNNISFEVIAFSDIDVEELLNLAYKKIRSVINDKNIICKHIGETRIYIYPYNSSSDDIYSYDLKIRANLIKPLNISYKDIIRWSLVFLLALICFIYSTKEVDTNTKAILQSITASAIFYLVIDFVLLILIPLIFKRGQRTIKINNLSSVVETTDVLPTNNDSLKIPE